MQTVRPTDSDRAESSGHHELLFRSIQKPKTNDWILGQTETNDLILGTDDFQYVFFRKINNTHMTMRICI